MSSSATFNENFYLTNNADVVVAISQGFFSSALQHYNLFGGKELRAPNATFDPNYYAVNNPDVLNAVASGVFPNVFEHYKAFGESENRAPTETYATFDAAGYLEANADVAAAVTAGTFSSALDHFISFGQSEERSGSGVSADATTTPGSVFTLATSAESLTGTANDDTFNAAITYNNTAPTTASTLTTADVINGGGGTGDRINVVVDGTLDGGATGGGDPVSFVVPTVTNVEKLYIRNVGTEAAAGDDLTVNVNNVPGLTEIFSDRSTSTLSITNLGAGDVVGINGDGVTNLGDVLFAYSTTSSAATINFTGGTQAANGTDITAQDNARTSATINSSGAANEADIVTLSAAGTVTSLAINATSNLSLGAGNAGDQVALANGAFGANASITITGAGSVDLETLGANVDTIDASGNSGGVTVALDAEVDTTFTGGAGNDTVSTGAALSTGSVNAGDGTDKLIVGTTAHLNSATLAGKYTNFETLAITNGVSIDLDLLSSITAVEMTDGAGTTALTDLSATQAGAITLAGLNGAATLGLKNAGVVGNVDTATITVSDGDSTASEAISAAGDITMANVENINFTLTDDLILDTLANMNEFSTITLSGGGNAQIYAGTTGVVINSTIDGSEATAAMELGAQAVTGNGMALKGGSGGDLIIGSANADALTGNAGNDTILGGDASDTIVGGAGNDTMDGGAGADVDTMTGGDGADIFGVDQNGTTTVDVISDLALGTDKIIETYAPSGGVVTSVTSATGGSLAVAAANAGTTIGANKAGIFTFGSDSYLLINDGTAGTISAADTVVKITGYTGTLASTDITTTGATLSGVGTAQQNLGGTRGGDTITAATGGGTITAGDGADAITGAAGVDNIAWTSTTVAALATEVGGTVGSGVVGDSISTWTSGADKLHFATTLTNNGTDTDTLKEIAKAGVVANNDVFVQVTNTAAGDNVDTLAGAVAVLNALTTSAVAIGEDVVFAMDNDTNMYLYMLTQVSVADTIAAQDVTFIGVINGITDVANGDFVSV